MAELFVSAREDQDVTLIYPKGFIVGRVETIERSGGAYRRIVVRPAVDSTALEEVLVVTEPAGAAQDPVQGPEPAPQAGGPE